MKVACAYLNNECNDGCEGAAADDLRARCRELGERL